MTISVSRVAMLAALVASASSVAQRPFWQHQSQTQRADTDASFRPLVAALDTLTLRENDFFITHGHYAATTAATGWMPADPSIQVLVLGADSAGWSAMAASSRMADYVCVEIQGHAVVPVMTETSNGRPVCGSAEGGFGAPGGARGRGLADRPPSQSCPPLQLTSAGRFAVPRFEQVQLQMVLDSTGPDPSYVRLTGGSTFNIDEIALEVLSHCHYTPARLNGRPIRTMIDVPIRVRP
jgi:hypothetical protein